MKPIKPKNQEELCLLKRILLFNDVIPDQSQHLRTFKHDYVVDVDDDKITCRYRKREEKELVEYAAGYFRLYGHAYFVNKIKLLEGEKNLLKEKLNIHEATKDSYLDQIEHSKNVAGIFLFVSIVLALGLFASLVF